MMTQFIPPEIWILHAVPLAFTPETQYEHFRVFGYQSEDRFISIRMKTRHLVHLMMVGVFTSDNDFMPWFISLHDLILNIYTLFRYIYIYIYIYNGRNKVC